MARIGVTYEQVAAAANELTSTGRRPTLEAIRRILGTGSNSTLVHHLQIWRAKEEGVQDIASKEQIPEALVVALKSVWQQVVEQSNQRVTTIETETQQTVDTMKQELLHAQQSNNLLQQQQLQLKQECDSLTLDKSSLNHLLNDVKIELASLTEKLNGSERQNNEKQERIEELQRQHQQVQANLEHYRAASLAQRQEDQQRYEQQINQLNYTVQSLNIETITLKKESVELQQKFLLMSFENDSLKDLLTKVEEQHQAQATELGNAQTGLVRKSQDVEYTSKQLLEVQQKYEAQSKILIDAQTKEAVSSQQILQLQKELKDTRDQMQVLSHEKLVLAQEKAQIYGQLKQLSNRN